MADEFGSEEYEEFFVASPAAAGNERCLQLELKLEPGASSPTIYLAFLDKCGTHSGKSLLEKLDRVALSINAEKITLYDASHINGKNEADIKSSFSYSTFMILATGKSYYNQFGYRNSDAGDYGADYGTALAKEEHNAAVIDKPFDDTIRNLLKSQLDRAAALLRHGEEAVVPSGLHATFQDICPNGALPAFLKLNTAGITCRCTTREIFQAIHKAKLIHLNTHNKWKSDPVFLWVKTVVDLFRDVIRRSNWLEKTPPRRGGRRRA